MALGLAHLLRRRGATRHLARHHSLGRRHHRLRLPGILTMTPESWASFYSIPATNRHDYTPIAA
jgi:hypothetical protein